MNPGPELSPASRLCKYLLDYWEEVGKGVKVVARNAGGGEITSIGFDGFGRLVNDANTVMASGSVVVCSPDVTNESGRVILISRMGRLNTTKVENPSC
jgi:hypothetical protein